MTGARARTQGCRDDRVARIKVGSRRRHRRLGGTRTPVETGGAEGMRRNNRVGLRRAGALIGLLPPFACAA